MLFAYTQLKTLVSVFSIIPAIGFCLLFFPGSGLSATVNLAWERPADTSRIAGYKIYYSLSRGIYSDNAVKVIGDPSKTTCSISGLAEGKSYSFVATSFDEDGLESSFSNEVSYSSPHGLKTDIDVNDRIDLLDAILALQLLTGEQPTREYRLCDVNGDQRIGIEEVVYVLRTLADST